MIDVRIVLFELYREPYGFLWFNILRMDVGDAFSASLFLLHRCDCTRDWDILFLHGLYLTIRRQIDIWRGAI